MSTSGTNQFSYHNSGNGMSPAMLADYCEDHCISTLGNKVTAIIKDDLTATQIQQCSKKALVSVQLFFEIVLEQEKADLNNLKQRHFPQKNQRRRKKGSKTKARFQRRPVYTDSSGKAMPWHESQQKHAATLRNGKQKMKTVASYDTAEAKRHIANIKTIAKILTKIDKEVHKRAAFEQTQKDRKAAFRRARAATLAGIPAAAEAAAERRVIRKPLPTSVLMQISVAARLRRIQTRRAQLRQIHNKDAFAAIIARKPTAPISTEPVDQKPAGYEQSLHTFAQYTAVVEHNAKYSESRGMHYSLPRHVVYNQLETHELPFDPLEATDLKIDYFVENPVIAMMDHIDTRIDYFRSELKWEKEQLEIQQNTVRRLETNPFIGKELEQSRELKVELFDPYESFSDTESETLSLIFEEEAHPPWTSYKNLQKDMERSIQDIREALLSPQNVWLNKDHPAVLRMKEIAEIVSSYRDGEKILEVYRNQLEEKQQELESVYTQLEETRAKYDRLYKQETQLNALIKEARYKHENERTVRLNPPIRNGQKRALPEIPIKDPLRALSPASTTSAESRSNTLSSRDFSLLSGSEEDSNWLT